MLPKLTFESPNLSSEFSSLNCDSSFLRLGELPAIVQPFKILCHSFICYKQLKLESLSQEVHDIYRQGL